MNERSNNEYDSAAEQVKLTTLITEYTTLREEILKRMDFQHQFISLTIIIVGTLLSIGLQPGLPVSPLYVYPLVAVFLTLGWKHHNLRVSVIGSYIRNNIESKLEYLNWETHFHTGIDQAQPKIAGHSWRILSANGIFVGTQVITIILALLRSSFSPIEIILFLSNLLAILISIRILTR